MAKEHKLDELWAVTSDNGDTFIDADGNEFKIRIWSDTHNLHNSREDAERSMNELDDQYEDLSVVKLSFSAKVTQN